MQDTLMIACPHCGAANRVPAARTGDNPSCGRCKAPLFQGRPAEVDATRLDALIARSDVPVVVDFWAPWCAPCRMMAPAFEQAARTLEPRYRLVKVNTEEQQALAAKFGIRSIPTVAVFSAGRELARQSGAMDAGTLVRWIQASA
ncbi:MAG: thioredoxin TrxC [Thiobacillaceae bacterium]|jgi:thioredoxin 2|nr:thioredoxin TrxC [Thiobacillaceae bacterium]